MAGRRSVFSDAAIVALTARFTPCADEVYRLQNGTDPECLAFRSMADGGHYRRAGGTRQGIYVATADGVLLASVNSLDPRRVERVLRDGLAAWEALPERERRPTAAEPAAPTHRWEQSLPVDGLVLESFVRELPDELDPAAEHVGRWNRDHVWMSAAEVEGWLPTDDALVVGHVHEVSPDVVARLARFHLVDNARGQTLPFAPDEVAGSRLRSEVVSVEGDAVRLRLSGRTLARSDGVWRLGQNIWTPRGEWPRGVVAELVGEALYDTRAERFVAFELVAQGLRWGRTRFNGRGRDGDGPSPLGWVLRLAPASAPAVAPTFVDLYDVPWVRHPEST